MVYFKSLSILLIFSICSCFGYRVYQDRIPNGHQVRNPCAYDTGNPTWRGVGHQNIGGGGLRNQFGLSFKANNFVSI